MNRFLTAASLIAALGLSPGAGAAFAWGSADLTTRSTALGAGFSLLPLPVLGSLGLQGQLERPYNSQNTVFSVGATLRDVNLPLTDLDGFVGAGLSFENTTRTYLEGGLRAAVLGPVGVTVGVRGYGGGGVRAGIGADIRF